jgi:hypothetical protein
MDIKNWIGCGGDKAEAAYRMGLAKSCQSWSAIDRSAESQGRAETAMWVNVALRADGSGKSCRTLFGRTAATE